MGDLELQGYPQSEPSYNDYIDEPKMTEEYAHETSFVATGEMHVLGIAHKHPPKRGFRKATGMLWSASHDRELKLEKLEGDSEYPFNIHYKAGKAPISNIVNIDLDVAYNERDHRGVDDYKMIITTERPGEGQRRWTFTNARQSIDLIKDIYKTIVVEHCQGDAKLTSQQADEKIKELDRTRDYSIQIYNEINDKYQIVTIKDSAYDFKTFGVTFGLSREELLNFVNSNNISYIGYQQHQAAIAAWNQKQSEQRRTSFRGRLRASISRKPNYRQFAVYNLMKGTDDEQYYDQWERVHHDILENFYNIISHDAGGHKKSDKKILQIMKAEDLDMVRGTGSGSMDTLALGGLLFGAGGKKTRKHRRKKGKKSRKHGKKHKHHIRKHKKLSHKKRRNKKSNKRRTRKH